MKNIFKLIADWRKAPVQNEQVMDWDALQRACVPVAEVHKDTVRALIAAANAIAERKPQPV